ncbi:MAG: sulfur carrier protein ThiS [Actinobacteria bacterium]|nr:sulfur carrier protein ThiS [Actinomycetota bacterium]
MTDRTATNNLTVTLNGVATELPHGAHVSDVVVHALKGVSSSGVAVAVDGVVVPRSSWSATAVAHGSTIELVTATQGG